jgi:hypothetical protein
MNWNKQNQSTVLKLQVTVILIIDIVLSIKKSTRSEQHHTKTSRFHEQKSYFYPEDSRREPVMPVRCFSCFGASIECSACPSQKRILM